MAIDNGLTPVITGSSDLPLWRVFKPGQGQQLHVYIDGDGTPWLRETIASADPTPSDPLLFPWFLVDSAPALYLGRPCYFGLNESGKCSPFSWTFGRYGEPVVDSMRSSLTEFLERHPFGDMVFIGHSGGAVLALLLAHSLDKPATIIGLSANIDTAAWTARHGFTPLWGSLNPARDTTSRSDIPEIYFFCENDQNTPYDIMREAISRRPAAVVRQLNGCGHRQGLGAYREQILHPTDQ